MQVGFTSDTHYGHANIIKYSGRPFANVDEMNDELVKQINKFFPNGGTLYHLGDWSMGHRENALKFRERLKNVQIILLEGNHDEANLKRPEFRTLFKDIYPILETHVNGKRMTMCHYAMKVWNKSHHGSWMLYGHSHNGLADDPHALSIDVGVDAAYARFGEFRPFTFQEVSDIMSKKKFVPIDHHQ